MNTKFLEKLKLSKDREFFELYISYLISPVITRAKPASIINITNNKNLLTNWKFFGDSFLTSLNLNYSIIKKKDDILVLLIYDNNSLSKILSKTDIKSLLNDFGYTDFSSISKTLSYLSYRFTKELCPHEIGIFLGIPLHDVVDFINNTEKPCLMCRYWKVYSNEDYALETFKKYDVSKGLVIDCLLNNKNLNDLCSCFSYKISA